MYKSEKNTAIFFKSSLVLNQKKNRFLHVLPKFNRFPESFDYEVHGSDGTRIENTVICHQNIKPIISFFCTMGETYFIKVIGKNRDSIQEFFLFYKVEDDFDGEEEEGEETVFEETDNQEEERNKEENEECEENKITKYLFRKPIITGLDLDLDKEDDFDINSL